MVFMNTRSLGPEGLTVSAIGLGCMGLSQGYGAADDAESIAAVHHAIDLGVNFLDTAQSYGSGHNEQLLGRALAGRREKVVLATKFGIVRGEDGVRVDARPENVRGYCEASLARLGVDHIDLYYQHRIDPQVPIEETVGAMAELVAEGKVRHLGLSEASPEELERAAATHPISAAQYEWSVWWRDIEDDVLPTARRLGIGLVPYSPLGRGFLAGAVSPDSLQPGDFRLADPRFQGGSLEHNRAMSVEVGRLAAEREVTPAQLVLAWLLAQGSDVVPIPGTRRAARITENAAAADLVLSASDLDRLEKAVPRSAWSGDRQSFAAYRTTRS
ncbi:MULTISPECIES: aldo/keto reductase [Kitasatospora]|uniref:Aldo/keto reductase n=1 Tax=Kitasatospora cystarginea TaxID=58350 RepID=A0ABN3E384_9ACTN